MERSDAASLEQRTALGNAGRGFTNAAPTRLIRHVVSVTPTHQKRVQKRRFKKRRQETKAVTNGNDVSGTAFLNSFGGESGFRVNRYG